MYGRTSSWTGADFFRIHWGVKNGVGGQHAYQMRKYTNYEAATSGWYDIYAELWAGDIVQYTNKFGETVHTQIVWLYGNGVMNVAQHSTRDRKWGLDIDLKAELEARKYDGGWVTILKIKKDKD